MLGPRITQLSEIKALSFDEREARIEALLHYCWDSNILEPGTFHDRHQLEWCVVPGGLYYISVISGEDSTTSRTCRLYIPSFLIQRYPVTNGQYLEFLRNYDPEHYYWPTEHRAKISNIYYLKSWTALLKRYSSDLEAWPIADFKQGQVDGKTSNWFFRPLVHVDWMGAAAFARSLGYELPSQTHYGAATRMYLSSETFEAPASMQPASDFPWDDARPDGYCIFATGDMPPVWPGWSASLSFEGGIRDSDTEAVLQQVAKFLSWRGAMRRPENVPLSLIDGIREWTSDRWSDQWPPEDVADYILDGEVATGLDLPTFVVDEENRIQYARKLQFAVRGGTFQLSPDQCRISFRTAQKGEYCNEDTGFRCVKYLVPLVSEF